MKKLLFTLALGAMALSSQAQDAANEMWWGNYSDQAQSITGNYQLGTYEAATFVDGSGDLKGVNLSGIRFRSRIFSANVIDAKVWVRASLDGENLAEGTLTTYGSSATTWSEGAFDAVTLPEEGYYVGYSFTLNNWYSDYDYTPVVYIKKDVPKSFYLKQPNETTFTDKSATGCVALQVKISGENIKTNAASIVDDMDDVIALVGNEVVITPTIKNLGTAGVSSIDYTYDLDGETKEGHADLATPIENMYQNQGVVSLSLGKLANAGEQEVTIKVTKVNGVENENTSKVKATVYVIGLASAATRKSLVEVYVGSAKYYSGRGYVGVERMIETLGDQIVPITIHMGDSLALDAYSARTSDSKYYNAPLAEVDRTFLTDPYYGDNATSPYHFAADQVVTNNLTKVSEADVEAMAEWTSEAQDSIAITATTTFKMTSNNAYYRLVFAVIKDSIKSMQNNYITYYKTNYPDDDMAYWRDQPWTGMAVNTNLVVASTDCNGVANSVPRKVNANEALSFETGLAVPVIEGKEGQNARLVVFLVNTNTREVVNANVAPIPDYGTTTGLKGIEQNQAAGCEVYNIKGQKVNAETLTPGLYIIREAGLVKKVLVK